MRDDILGAHRDQLIKLSSTSIHKSFVMTKEVHQVNVKMSHKLTVFLRLLINTCLKKQTIYNKCYIIKIPRMSGNSLDFY
jgi:hypothetical protein